MVVRFMRHAARTPFKNNTNFGSFNGSNPGEITQKGKESAEREGAKFMEKYSVFLELP